MYINYYQTLGLLPECSEAELRKRYLELVRQYPPESHPEQFSRIHNAYENLRNPIDMLPDILFSRLNDDSIEKIIQEVQVDTRDLRLPTAMILKMGEV